MGLRYVIIGAGMTVAAGISLNLNLRSAKGGNVSALINNNDQAQAQKRALLDEEDDVRTIIEQFENATLDAPRTPQQSQKLLKQLFFSHDMKDAARIQDELEEAMTDAERFTFYKTMDDLRANISKLKSFNAGL